MPGQRVANAEIAFHPEIAEPCAGFHEIGYAIEIGDSSRLRVPVFIPPKDVHLFGIQGVQEER